MPDPSGVPPTGWYVHLEHPDGTILTPTVLDDPQYLPSVNSLPQVRIPVEYHERYLDASWEHAAMRVYYNGKELPIERLENVEMGDESRATLVAIGGIELNGQTTREYQNELATTVLSDIFGETSYDVTVDPDPGITFEDVTAQDVTTTADFEGLITDSTLPIIAANGGLELSQTAWAFEAEGDFLSMEANSVSYSDGTATGVYQSSSGNVSDFDFSPQYTIPSDDVVVAARKDEGTDVPGFRAIINGQSAGSVTNGFNSSSLSWLTFHGYGGSDLQPGTHTVGIEQTGESGGSMPIDVIAVYDGRYPPTLDNTVHQDNGYLDGPEEYPASVQTWLNEADMGYQIEHADLDVTASDTSGNFTLHLREGDGTEHTAANTTSLATDFTATATTVQGGLTLGRYQTGTQAATPRLVYEGQSISDWTIIVDTSDTPLVQNRTLDGSRLEIAKDVTHRANYIFEVGIDRSTDPSTLTIDVTRPGRRTADIDLPIQSYSTEKRLDESYQQATIYGGSNTVHETITGTGTHGEDIALNHQNIVEGSETVYANNASNPDERTEDYTIDNVNGTIQYLASGSIGASATRTIDYAYRPKGVYTADGATDTDASLTDALPSLTTQRATEQAALAIVTEAQDPLYEAEVVLQDLPPTVSLIDALDVADLPTGGNRLTVNSITYDPERIQLSLGTRRALSDIISDIQNRLSAASRRA